MLTKIFSFFLPKDKIFFALIEKSASNIFEMGSKLSKMVHEADKVKRNTIASKIKAMEVENDQTTNEILVELSRNFITPFDREDIHYLAVTLDEVANLINSCSKKIDFYKINPQDKGIQKLAHIIKDSVQYMKNVLMELKQLDHSNEITEGIARIKGLENQADDVYDLSIESLFDQEDNFKKVIKKMEIYFILESVTDKCKDVSKVVESILIKYA